MRTGSKTARLVVAATAVYVGAFAMVGVRAQTDKRPMVPPTSLLKLAVVQPPNIGDFIQDNQAAIVLGKALFWEIQASSDNTLACASCHFHAGADDRIKNELDPNMRNTAAAPIPTTFNPMATANKGGPNYTLRAGDFPFHQLADPNDRESQVTFDSNDVVGSQGVYAADFDRLFGAIEKSQLTPDGLFVVGPIQTRRDTGRNTPSVINAALNYRNFWDGRANSVFNGRTPFGPHDADARVWVDDVCVDATGVSAECAVQAVVRIPYSSAASQAVGPALSNFEMSGANRTFADLGQKLLWSWPLSQQAVSTTDSVLGSSVDGSGYGLTASYEAMIQKAFYPEYWAVPDAIYQASSGDTTHTQMAANFSLFWGLAIQAYEQTLISDDAPYDRFTAGNQSALTDAQRHGLAIFSSERGRCATCHKGAEFTGASTRMVIGAFADGFAGDGPIENMLMGDNQTGLYDNGFYNIGVVPASNDLGVGGTDAWGGPLSFTRQLKSQLSGGPAPDAMTHSLTPCDFQSAGGCDVVYDPNFREAVDGSFKAPSLRNVELTGPYFHTGGYATLEQVVDFYSRGGNVRSTGAGDTSGYSPNGTNLDIDVRRIGFTDVEKADLVAFLKSLTDDRVRYERAPFDHPELIIPNGAWGDNNMVQSLDNIRADDQLRVIPAVGAAGLTSPVKPFTPKP
jgi:cytochrome c peroxidase